MTAHPFAAFVDSLFDAARKPKPLTSWAAYKASSDTEQQIIRSEWSKIAHGYKGDGSQREEAFQLYNRACIERRGKYPQQHPRNTAEDYDGQPMEADGWHGRAL